MHSSIVLDAAKPLPMIPKHSGIAFSYLIVHSLSCSTAHKTLQKTKHSSWHLALCQLSEMETFQQLIM